MAALLEDGPVNGLSSKTLQGNAPWSPPTGYWSLDHLLVVQKKKKNQELAPECKSTMSINALYSLADIFLIANLSQQRKQHVNFHSDGKFLILSWTHALSSFAPEKGQRTDTCLSLWEQLGT